jgi:hypothetical protein
MSVKGIIKVQVAAAVFAVALATGLIAAPAASADPKAVTQAYGVPASGMCDAATAVESANIPGAPVGGWVMGWGTWLNGGKGGAACVRVLNYNNSTHSWVVGK